MRTLLLIASLILSLQLSAQFPGFGGGSGGSSILGNVSGMLVDSLSQEPVEFATVVLMKRGKQINGTISDAEGKFKITEVKGGTYSLQVSFLGFDDKTIKAVKVTPEKPDVELKNIELNATSTELTEVVIEGERSTVEVKIDKIVYNAEKDATNTGGDASDVMRKVPMLSVDLDGNVSLRGSSNIRILINGKPSSMFANSVADALKTIPADQIKKVEVITSPSAKYDGEGSAGIVNIITKKKTIEGINGNVNASAGNRQNSLNVSLNAAKGRFGFNSSAGLYYSIPQDGLNSSLREEFDANGTVTQTTKQDGITNSERLGFFGRLGAFYDFNAYNSFNTSVRFNGRKFNRDGDITMEFINNLGDYSFTRESLSNTLNSGFDWTTDYTKTYKGSEREWSASFQLSGNSSDTDNDLNQFTDPSNFLLREFSTNDGLNLEYTLQTDYVHPFGKKVKLETGLKGILRKIDSDYQFNLFDNDANDYLYDGTRSDKFNYQQDVYSGYASLRYNFGKNYGLIAGARYEYTDIGGDFEGGATTVSNEYGNILPSITLSKRFKNFHSLKLSYTRRIQRPSLYYINPFVNNSDPSNISYGKPDLAPELTDQYEIGYNMFFKGGVIFNISTYFKQTDDVISQYTTVSNGVSENTNLNVGVRESIGFNVFGSGTIAKRLTIRGNFNLSSFILESKIADIDLQNEGYAYNAFLSGSYSFPKDYKLEVFGFFRSPQFTLQGETPSFSIFSIGAKKDIWNKKGSIGIRIVEPFNKYKFFDTNLSGENFSFNSSYGIPFRSVGVSFSYRFGKMDFKRTRQRRSKIRNTDQKSGEEGGGQGGGGQGGGGQ